MVNWVTKKTQRGKEMVREESKRNVVNKNLPSFCGRRL